MNCESCGNPIYAYEDSIEGDFGAFHVKCPVGKSEEPQKLIEFKKPEPVKAAKGAPINDKTKENIKIIAHGLIQRDTAVTADNIYKEWPLKGYKSALAGKRPSTTQIYNFITSKEYEKGMRERGVISSGRGLSAEQSAALIELTTGTGTLESKLKRLGISKSEWRTWLRQKSFNEAYSSFAGVVLKDAIPQAKAQLAAAAEAGDFKSIKFLMEVTGVYNPNQQSAVDMQALIGIIIDVMQEKILDPKLKSEIQEEIKFRSQGVKGVL